MVELRNKAPKAEKRGRPRKKKIHKCKGVLRKKPDSNDYIKHKYCYFCWDRVIDHYESADLPLFKIKCSSYEVVRYKELCKTCHNNIGKYWNTKDNKHDTESLSNFTNAVLNSRINSGNLGLFTLKERQEEEIISEYDGKVVRFDSSNKSDYIINVEVTKRKNAEGNYDDIITQVKDGDPKKCPLNLHKLAAYANDRYPQVDDNNAYFFLKTNKDDGKCTVELRALRNIKANEEIYVAYGSNYFKKDETDNSN